MFERPSWLHPLDTPCRVWVDVQRLLPRHIHEVYRDIPDGLDLGHEVVGLVSAWARRGDGGWLALTSYQLPARDRQGATELMTHWVPSHLIRKDSLVRRHREQSGLGH